MALDDLTEPEADFTAKILGTEQFKQIEYVVRPKNFNSGILPSNSEEWIRYLYVLGLCAVLSIAAIGAVGLQNLKYKKELLKETSRYQTEQKYNR